MTEKQAYKILTNTPIRAKENHTEYSKALHIALGALEREIAEKPNGMFDSVPHYRCPHCGKAVVMFCDDKHYPNCQWCGQALLWEGDTNVEL